MNCRKARSAIQLGLDGELPAARRDDLARHLTGCAECRKIQSQFAAIQSAMHQLAVKDADEQPGRLEFGAARPATSRRLMAVAAVLVAAMGLWLMVERLQAPSDVDTVADHSPARKQPVIARGEDELGQRDVRQANGDNAAPPASADRRPAVSPKVHVRVESPSDTIVVPMQTKNPNVSVFWLYPAIKTAEAPADQQQDNPSAS